MEHLKVAANGAAFHVARTGKGPPLVAAARLAGILADLEPVMARLADRFTLIAPDLRGFGDSDKPDGTVRARPAHPGHAGAAGCARPRQVGVVGHDVGGAVMQPLARTAPERVCGLFFFDFVYPGIGPRMAEPDRLNNIWYQSFNQIEIAPAMVGASRETCRAYIGHFCRHWSYRKQAFDDVLEAFIDNFLKPGNLAGGFAHYRAAHAGRDQDDEGRGAAAAADRCADLHPLGRARSVVSLRLDRPLERDVYQSRSEMFPGVGHFPHREDPDRASDEIAAFFGRIDWAGEGTEVESVACASKRGGTARRDKTLAVPCRFIEILAGSAASRSAGATK